MGRCENITAVYEAYKGEKRFATPWDGDDAVYTSDYDLLVTDEFVSGAKATVIMIGHGISGGKTYGLDQPRPYHNRREAEKLAWVITTSKDMINLVAQQCGVHRDKVLPYGMPRTDVYFGKKKGDGGSGLPIEKRIYLYCPTFASWQMTEDSRVMIDNLLNDNELFVIKRHMFTGMKESNGTFNHSIEVSTREPSAPYLIDCDVLITDFSSILFDGHVLGKPVVLFEKDRDRYMSNRGMYRPYPEGYSSRHVTDEKDLVRAMRVAKEPRQEDIQCKWQCAGACDGHSTERVVSLIEDMLNGHEETMRVSAK